MTLEEQAEMRRMVADYMSSEGCSCCRDIGAHKKHAEALAIALGIKRYDDGSGYDFFSCRSVAE